MMESACERRAACYVTLACYLDEISLRNRTRGIHNEGALGAYSYLLTGSPEQMYSNFMKLGKLPKDTLVYCGHEYTLKNLAYASYADPEVIAQLCMPADTMQLGGYCGRFASRTCDDGDDDEDDGDDVFWLDSVWSRQQQQQQQYACVCVCVCVCVCLFVLIV